MSLQPDGDLRIGDTERRAVDARLSQAVGDGVLTLTEYDERARDVWAARTRRELDAVVRDLPAAPSVPVLAAPGRRRTSVAVMGEDRLDGHVAPGQGVAGYAVLGQSHLDLRRGDLPPSVQVRAVAVMGGVEVLVPEGAAVQLTGAAVMGDRRVAVGPPVAGGPVVHVHGIAVLGSVQVRSGAVASGPAGAGSGAAAGSPAGSPVGVAVGGGIAAAPGAAAPGAARRSGVRPRRRGKHGLACLAVAGVVVAGATGAFDGDGAHRGGSGDRLVVVQPGDPVVDVPRGSGDVTVVVPDGVRAVQELRPGSGDVECDTACTVSSDRTVRVTGGGGSGDVEIETRAEHED